MGMTLMICLGRLGEMLRERNPKDPIRLVFPPVSRALSVSSLHS